MDTIASLSGIPKPVVAGNEGTALRVLRAPRNARFALVCFPCAGASASFYYPWKQYWGERETLISVQLPGREDRRADPPATELTDLAAAIAFELHARHAGIPLVFFGHSFGALLALETIRVCQRDGLQNPVHFFPSARVAPHLPRPARFLGVHDDATLVADMRAIGFEHEKLLEHPGFLRMLLPVLRADFALNDGYRCTVGNKVKCATTALAGANDPLAPPHLVEEWRSVAAGAFDLRVFQGDHFYLRSCLAALCETMRGIIDNSLVSQSQT